MKHLRVLPTIMALALIASITWSSGPAGAEWRRAAGTPKKLFLHVLYDPASARFDPRLNVDSVRARYILSDSGRRELAGEIEKNPSCSEGLRKFGPCTAVELLLEFDGIARYRISPASLINARGDLICTMSLDDDSWSTIEDNSPEFSIYFETVVVPDHAATAPPKGIGAQR